MGLWKYVLVVAWCFCRTPDSRRGGISDPFACSWDFFPPTGLTHPELIEGFVSSLIVAC